MRSWWLACGMLVMLAGCNAGGRDATDVAEDFSGTVGAPMSERLLRNVDLARVPLVVSVAGEPEQHFGADRQQALEEYLAGTVRDLAGDTIAITQQVVEESATGTSVTITLRVTGGQAERFVPVAMELQRAGRSLVLSRVRVMLARAPDREGR